MDQWWEEGESLVAHWRVRELDRKHNPAEMIEAIIDVSEAEHPPYRTVRPPSTKEMVHREQEDAWRIRIWPRKLGRLHHRRLAQ